MIVVLLVAFYVVAVLALACAIGHRLRRNQPPPLEGEAAAIREWHERSLREDGTVPLTPWAQEYRRQRPVQHHRRTMP